MGVLWVRDVVKTKRWNIRFILAVMYMTLIYLLVEYRLVYSFLFTKEPNSRDEYFHAQLPFWRAFKLTFKNYILGHTHVMTVHTLVILPVLFFAFYMVLKNRRWKEERVFIWLFF